MSGVPDSLELRVSLGDFIVVDQVDYANFHKGFDDMFRG